MTWTINVPFRDPGDLVLDTIPAAREALPAEEARVVEAVANDALGRGVSTVGALLDELQQAGLAERRRLLDAARRDAGVDSIASIESQRRLNEAARHDPPPPPRWSEWQTCGAEGCQSHLIDSEGRPMPVEVERWHCEKHKHLAQPGDMEKHEPPYIGVNRCGAPIPSEKERRRVAEHYAEYVRDAEKLDAARQAEAEKRAEVSRQREEYAREQTARRFPLP